jgi:hypothetical protein
MMNVETDWDIIDCWDRQGADNCAERFWIMRILEIVSLAEKRLVSKSIGAVDLEKDWLWFQRFHPMRNRSGSAEVIERLHN